MSHKIHKIIRIVTQREKRSYDTSYNDSKDEKMAVEENGHKNATREGSTYPQKWVELGDFSQDR